ncbi:MAG: CCE_0567 family metalloprotein [Gammaproteobacteria bacterium]
MTPEEMRKLEKNVRKAKRLAGEKAMELHDLVEDRLPAGYTELMEVAQATFEACKEWDDANKALLTAQGETA